MAPLAMQPGFLEARLALASMQRESDEPEALATATAALKQAETLIPKGFKGRILWGHLGNRFCHCLMWLQLELQYERGGQRRGSQVGAQSAAPESERQPTNPD